MADIFGMNCVTVLGNTGSQDCDDTLGLPIGVVSVKRNASIPITSSMGDTLYETLDNLTRNNDAGLRYYPLYGIQSTADNTQAPTTATANGTGNVQTLRDAKPAWTWTFWPTICQWTAFQKFNGQEKNRDFFVVTDKNQLVGINRGGNAMGGLRFSRFYVSPLSFRGDDAPSVGTIEAVYDNTREWRENMVVVTAADGELSELTGVLDAQPINLNAEPLPLAGTFKIGVMSGCGGGSGSTSLIPTYETILEDTDNWVVTNATTNGVITVTSITATVNGNNSYLTFVMPTTAPYVAGDGVKFQLAGITTLDTAGMIGYEGKSVVVPNVV